MTFMTSLYIFLCFQVLVPFLAFFLLVKDISVANFLQNTPAIKHSKKCVGVLTGCLSVTWSISQVKILAPSQLDLQVQVGNTEVDSL